MPLRTREPGDCALDLPEELRVFDELARKREITPIDSLSRRKTGVVLGSSPEP